MSRQVHCHHIQLYIPHTSPPGHSPSSTHHSPSSTHHSPLDSRGRSVSKVPALSSHPVHNYRNAVYPLTSNIQQHTMQSQHTLALWVPPGPASNMTPGHGQDNCTPNMHAHACNKLNTCMYKSMSPHFLQAPLMKTWPSAADTGTAGISQAS